ncbi:MAG: hypothetical protein ACE5JX_22350, partial [Acidobacteriota bacterium]
IGYYFTTIEVLWGGEQAHREKAWLEHSRNLDRLARRWSQKHGLPFLSLTEKVAEALERVPVRGRLSFPDDPHPNAETHRLMATIVQRWLMRRLEIEAAHSPTGRGAR